ncbi:DNA cytosine methyltransferase [Streptomyces sp. NPDC008125]|uniref:DNA cytosine methyltransferase n=1 Tax=Streptomyces sp. NPDC008125 TaxID=3364811 RepID=UPI0036EEE638
MSRQRGAAAASMGRLGLDDVLAATARPVPPVPGQSSLDDAAVEPLRIGSLFTGYGGLDMGVQMVLGGEVVWHCQYDPEDQHQYAARILAHHWPAVPNLGDITRVDWQRVLDELGPIDVLIGGFPCTDLSSAGKRAGLMTGTRSGLWSYMLRAAEILRPRLVVIENVRGILSTQASSGVDPCPCCLEHAGSQPLLRALGAVLGDMADIGLDAEWEGIRASDVGAPHERFREFVLGWPADADGSRLEGEGVRRAVAQRLAVAADPDHVGHERRRAAWAGQSGSSHDGLSALDSVGGAVADADGYAVRQQPVSRVGGRRPAVGGRRRAEASADAEGGGRAAWQPASTRQFGRSDAAERRLSAAADAQGRRCDSFGELPAGWDALRQWVRNGADGCGPAVAHSDSGRRVQVEHDVRAGQPDVEWGDYEPAIRRWETILGRRHPWPNDVRRRLAPEFSEWMQGIPAGHVTGVPGAPGMSEAALRNARLKAIGNGVVPLQSAVAIGLLLDRVQHESPIRRLLARAQNARIAA